MRKATQGHEMSEAEAQTNDTMSRMRVRVEYIFARISQMGVDFCRSIGVRRAAQHNHHSNLVYNTDRYAYLVCLRCQSHLKRNGKPKRRAQTLKKTIRLKQLATY